MPKLKVYASSDGTFRYVVATTSIKKAAAMLDTTQGEIRNYGFVVPEDRDCISRDRLRPVFDDPGTIFKQRMRSYPEPPWEKA